ncbi:cytochrome P450 [Marinococcus sp. PL1-022]|uniref:cytochrome P450 family protein n=1 Tax=Marinococcus sp. PL1-022 TaxID=3095363 RepID=UPI0029C5E809|nr:cytochrome P450 [Marinococcus sp. PL1-022]MDX6152703.1 cytochrome P450 [Marinococcus sp. PL1-022]
MDQSSDSVQTRVLGILSGKSREDPFSVFAEARAEGPVLSIPHPMGSEDNQAWLVPHMDEALQVLKDKKGFTVDPSYIDADGVREQLTDSVDEEAPDTFFTGTSMLFMDGLDHRRLRSLVSKAFTLKYMESLRPRVQEIADELLDNVEADGEMDLVKDYAYPLPINVISEMLGVPEGDRAQIQTWSSAIAQGMGWGRQDPAVTKHLEQFGKYTKQLVESKRQAPGDDLISKLVTMEEEDDRLSESELISMITLLIFAGHETTSNLIATGAFELFDHPEELQALKNDRSLVPGAVEELLRFNGPSTAVGPRYATQDTEIAGQPIAKGDMVLVLVKSANRDEKKFTEAEDLKIQREIDRHLAFGQGLHMCLGAPLARIEGDVAFSTLFQRLPNLQLKYPREEITWSFVLSSQGLESLPVTFSFQ